jgi:hypothetical protein
LSIFREGWNGYDKVIDNSSIGEYADLTLSDAFANPPLTGSGPQFNSLNSYFIFDGNYNSGYNELGDEQDYEDIDFTEQGGIIIPQN